MRLRTQILFLIAALMLGTLFAFEKISSQTIEPEFERQALEMVSLLSLRGRDSLERSFETAENSLGILTRLFSPINGELREPGPAIYEALPYSALGFFQKESGGWKWLGPKDQKATSPPTLKQGLGRHKQLQKTDQGWNLWVGQDERLISLQIPNSEVQPFQELGQASRAFLMIKQEESVMTVAQSATAPPAELEHWANWVRESGFTDKVETVTWQGEPYYAALASSAKYPFAIFTLWSQKDVHAQWSSLKSRVRAVFAILIALAAILVLVMIRQVTSPIEKLEAATHKLSGGDFDLSFGSKRQGEVGRLMTAFETMSLKIQELLSRTKENTRMEMELQTAKLVQENFYPKTFNEFPPVMVAGRTIAASECGGDLWNCWETDKFAYVMIADATGHGVSAALLTSSLHAVLTVLDSAQADHLDLITLVLRRAIEKSGRGTTSMTAILLQIEKASGLTKIFNASHEACVVIPSDVNEQTKWKDLKVITEPVNSALGRETNDPSAWAEVQLAPGDRIFLYTDGILELKTDDGKSWKDRQLLTAVLSEFRANKGKHVGEVITSLFATLDPHLSGQVLVDDLSLVLIEWSPKDS